MRIHTGTSSDGMSIWYLDRVRFGDAPDAPVHVTTVLPSHAELSFLGAPSYEDRGNPTHPMWNVPDGGGLLDPASATFGRFTRYGDVRELVSAVERSR